MICPETRLGKDCGAAALRYESEQNPAVFCYRIGYHTLIAAREHRARVHASPADAPAT